jgi:hypothetical protein
VLIKNFKNKKKELNNHYSKSNNPYKKWTEPETFLIVKIETEEK